MFNLGATEVIVILIVVLFLFGGLKKLPELGSNLANALINFKKGMKAGEEIDVTPKAEKKEATEEKK